MVSEGLCCCGRQVSDLEIFFSFSATKQDRVGPSLQAKMHLFTFCSLLYSPFSGTGSVDSRDTL